MRPAGRSVRDGPHRPLRARDRRRQHDPRAEDGQPVGGHHHGIEHERGDLELFDAREVAKKRKGDVDIARVGRDAAVPWQVDGRKWHTQDRPARSGRTVQWEGAALAFVVDLLEEIDGLKETNWNDQRTVEITAEQKTGTGWFFHALTGDEWFVRLYFRVPKKTFDADDLQHRLGLTPVDDIDEIPVYGRGERVKVNESKGPFQEVAIDVHERDEIDTPGFRAFVQQAARAYLAQVRQQAKADPADVMPWKVLGRKWHESRKGFPSNKRVDWSTGVAQSLFDLLEQSLPGSQFDWGNKTLVAIRRQDGEPIAEVQTKRRDGLYLTLLTEPGRVALGQVADLAAEQEIAPHRSGKEAVKLRFDTLKQVKAPKLRHLLSRLAEGDG